MDNLRGLIASLGIGFASVGAPTYAAPPSANTTQPNVAEPKVVYDFKNEQDKSEITFWVTVPKGTTPLENYRSALKELNGNVDSTNFRKQIYAFTNKNPRIIVKPVIITDTKGVALPPANRAFQPRSSFYQEQGNIVRCQFVVHLKYFVAEGDLSKPATLKLRPIEPEEAQNQMR